MEEALPSFPLFLDPVAEGSFSRSDETCACCGRARGWLHACSSYGPGDNERPICPWCIADGSAAKKFDCVFNDGTIYPCRDGAPQLPDADRELVERRTPGFVTWQGARWRMCCGRACVYIGEADAADLEGRWAAAVPSILKEVPDWSPEQQRELIGNISKGAGPCAYIFRCQVCGALSGFSDVH